MSPAMKGCASLAAAGALALVAIAAHADAPTGLTVETPTAGGAIHALIGSTTELQPLAGSAVIRLGPADANWNFADSPILDDLTCLTQAVYYEARSESIEGQEGVAQVVLNRARTPGFPTAVCLSLIHI